MEISPKSRRRLRLEQVAFMVLFLAALGLVAWLSTQYRMGADWSAGARNTLSATSQAVLGTLDADLSVTIFARDNRDRRRAIENLLLRYQRQYPALTYRFVNPDTDPEQVRALNITVDGEMLLQYNGRSEQVDQHTEQALTNAIQRLVRQEHRWVMFITGHGERSPSGQANHDLSTFARHLERRGLQIRQLNLARTPVIPDNASVAVIAGPRVNLLPGEVEQIQSYVRRGGNLLWLADPGDLYGLEPLAADLGITFLPGVVVDAATQMFGIRDPAMALVTRYPDHAMLVAFKTVTLYPRAAALRMTTPEGWQATPLLRTQESSWTETGPLEGNIQYDEGIGEVRGPLTLGVALGRSLRAQQNLVEDSGPDEARNQRVIVIGDGDFLSNNFLANGGNLDLGLTMLNWLNQDEQLVSIPAHTATDRTLVLSPTVQAVIGFGFLFVLPALLFGAGLFIWARRRRL